MKILYDEETNQAFEFLEVEMSRDIRRDFFSKGTTKKVFNGKNNFGMLLNSRGTLICDLKASMNIGDTYDGRRVMDIDFKKFTIAPDGKDLHVVGFVYKLD